MKNEKAFQFTSTCAILSAPQVIDSSDKCDPCDKCYQIGRSRCGEYIAAS